MNDDGDHPWVMTTWPSSKDGHHHPSSTYHQVHHNQQSTLSWGTHHKGLGAADKWMMVTILGKFPK